MVISTPELTFADGNLKHCVEVWHPRTPPPHSFISSFVHLCACVCLSARDEWGATIWGCSDINNQMWSSCWPWVRGAGQVRPFVCVQALWRLLRLTGMGTVAGEIRLTEPQKGAWHSQEQRVARVCHFYPFSFLSSFFGPPSTVHFSWDSGPA